MCACSQRRAWSSARRFNSKQSLLKRKKKADQPLFAVCKITAVQKAWSNVLFNAISPPPLEGITEFLHVLTQGAQGTQGIEMA